MSDMDAVIEKISKIQRLAERGGTPEEAAAAAAKVQQLLQQHGLDMAEIDLAAGLPTLSGYGHQQYDVGKNWGASLFNALCRNNDCKFVTVNRYGNVCGDIIGHKDNVEGVIQLFEWLSDEINRLCDHAWKTEGDPDLDSSRSWKNSYRNGAVQTISARLYEERKTREAELAKNNHTTALIAISKKVDEVTRELYPRLRTSNRYVRQGPGFAAGQRDGAGMSLNRRQNLTSGRGRIK